MDLSSEESIEKQEQNADVDNVKTCPAELPVTTCCLQESIKIPYEFHNCLPQTGQTNRECTTSNDNKNGSLFKTAFYSLSPCRFRVFLNSVTHQLALKDNEIAQLQSYFLAEKQSVQQLINEKNDLERRLVDDNVALCALSKELEGEKSLRKSEVAVADEKLRKHDEAAKRAIQQLQQEMSTKLLEASKQIEELRKEKESVVMRFVQSEQQVIDSKVLAEQRAETARLAVKERDFFQERIKMLTEERKKVQAFIDQKTMEVSQLQKEAREAKESAKEADAKLRLAQAKAKNDQDALQEMRLKLERTMQQLISCKDELEHAKQDLSDKEHKHKTEKEQSDIQHQQEFSNAQLELAEINERLRFELDSLKQRHRECFDENITFKDRVTCLTKELADRNEELAAAKNKTASLQDEVLGAREEVNAAMERTAELVEHNQQLSMLRSQIQADQNGLKETLTDLQRDFAIIFEENSRLKNETSVLLTQMGEERRDHTTQLEQAKAELATFQSSADELQKRLQEQESLLLSSRRKHTREVKELQRQLRGQQSHLSSDQPLVEINAGTSGLSRASSNCSDLDKQPSHSLSSSSLKISDQTPQQQFASVSVDAPIANGEVAVIDGSRVEVSRQQIVDRLVGLQRALAKKSERLDFLNEQVRCLTDEVQKKSRIIQVLATRETAESGAFMSDDMDKHRASMAKRAGIMASVLSSELHDGKMTLELSLEIGRKLQEVLEETLLKNIMLKESLDTLGHEISHLSKENRDLKLTLKGVLGETTAPGSRR